MISDPNPSQVKIDSYKYSLQETVSRLDGIVTEEKLQELVDSGYAPCVRHTLTNKVYFCWMEIKEWIHKNFARHQQGADLPRRFIVYSGTPSESMRPVSLVAIDHLQEYDFSSFPPCVYFLCDKNCVIYVGQSVNLPSRLMAHIADGKSFSKVFFVPVPKSLLDATELAFIHALNPVMNNPIQGFRELKEKEKQILRHFGFRPQSEGQLDEPPKGEPKEPLDYLLSKPEDEREEALSEVISRMNEVRAVNPDLLEQ